MHKIKIKVKVKVKKIKIVIFLAYGVIGPTSSNSCVTSSSLEFGIACNTMSCQCKLSTVLHLIWKYD
jgi:acid phosphatase family membrane protein YuiD